jgi:hypothetical protein
MFRFASFEQVQGADGTHLQIRLRGEVGGVNNTEAGNPAKGSTPVGGGSAHMRVLAW